MLWWTEVNMVYVKMFHITSDNPDSPEASLLLINLLFDYIQKKYYLPVLLANCT